MWWSLLVGSVLSLSVFQSLGTVSDHDESTRSIEQLAEEAAEEQESEKLQSLPYKVGCHVKYSYREENMSHIDQDSVLNGWVQPELRKWKLLRFQHPSNNYSVPGQPLFARDEDAQWYKFDYPPLVLQHHLMKIPVYKGEDVLKLTAEDFKPA